MGDAADDIINGDCCEECGEWIGNGEGYPQKCRGCKSGENEEEGGQR